MKKAFALLGSLLLFAGVKAQTPPTVKKETVKPMPPKLITPTDSLKAVKGGANLKQAVNAKAIKVDHIKKTTPLEMKETPAVTKPQKY